MMLAVSSIRRTLSVVLPAAIAILPASGLAVPKCLAWVSVVKASDTGQALQRSSQSLSVTPRQELYVQSTAAAERVERHLAAMVPGRSWRWGLDAEQSRKRLDKLRQDLNALKDTEAAFEESLSSGEKLRAERQLRSIHKLLEHVKCDAQSLDRELRKGEPTRWHVAHDVSDMQKEIHRWSELHRQLATTLSMSSQ